MQMNDQISSPRYHRTETASPRATYQYNLAIMIISHHQQVI